MAKLKVGLIFPIREKQELYVNLDLPTGYDITKFKDFKPTYLSFANKKIRINYIGLSMVKGNIVLVVGLDDPNYTKVEQIGEQKCSDMFIE